MSNPPVLLDLKSRDWEANLETLEAYTRSRVPNSWNSYFSGDIGRILLEVIAYDHAILSFISDFQSREAAWKTFTLRESAQNFATFSGYKIRRSRPATLHVMLTSTSAPSAPDFYKLRRGQRVISQDGQAWEVASDYVIEPGYTHPKRTVLEYGDLSGSDFLQDDTSEKYALIKINTGDSHATLVHPSGNRLSTDVNFGKQVGQGFILKLGARLVAQAYFTAAPQQSEREYAIVSVGKLLSDSSDGSVLYLDRPWVSDPFIGKWAIEDRGVSLLQKETFQETFTTPSEELAGWSIGCNFHPVIDGSSMSGIVALVDGERWLEVESLLLSTASDKVYEVSFDQDDKATLKFGDGIYGALLSPGSTITVEYSVGGGIKGNVQPGSFSATVKLESSLAVSDASAYLTNPYTNGIGGQDQESIEEIRLGILNTIKASNRAVFDRDFETLAVNFYDGQSGSVAVAKASLRQNRVPQEGNIVWVHIWTSGPSGFLMPPSFLLKQRLQTYLSTKAMVGTEVVVLDGSIRHLPIIVRLQYSGQAESAKESLRSAIFDLISKHRIGSSLRIGDLYDVSREASGVEHLKYIYPNNDTPISSNEVLLNTLSEGSFSGLSVALQKGSVNIPVDRPENFSNGGLITITEAGRLPTVSIIESVSGGVVTMRDTGCLDDYSLKARVYNTDFVPIIWEAEKPITLYIDVDVVGLEQRIAEALKFKLEMHFDQHQLPGQSVTTTEIDELVGSTPGITGYKCYLSKRNNEVKSISCLRNELIVLSEVVLNGKRL